MTRIKNHNKILPAMLVFVLLVTFILSSIGPSIPSFAKEQEVTTGTQEQKSVSEDQTENDSAEETTIADSLSAPPKAAPSSSSKTLVKESEDYKVSVKIDEESVASADAELVVEEIDKDSEEYKVYIAESAKKMEVEEENFAFAHAFDIHLEKDGQEIQPEQPVDVSIELPKEEVNKETSNVNIVHFGDEVEVVDSDIKKEKIEFSAKSFSVYVVVDAPDPVPIDDSVITIDELNDEYSTEGFRLSVTRNNTTYYFTNRMNNNLGYITENSDVTKAAPWLFEAVEGTTDKFYIYTKVDGNIKYLKNTSGNLVGLVDSGGTVFQPEQLPNNQFYIKVDGENKWLQHSNSAGGIRLWTAHDNAANSKILFEALTSHNTEDDPYDFDGKSYVIANYKSGEKAYALSPEAANNGNALKTSELLVRADPLAANQTLGILSGSDVHKWTFESIAADNYYLKADGKYLKVQGNNISLVDTPDDYCVIRALPGSGARKGKVRLLGVESGTALSYNGSTFIARSASDANEWLNLAEDSVYDDDDFVSYRAEKVSVSDKVNVPNGQQVIVYTRVWNDTSKKYDFYAIDHNGDLIRCYESGDRIYWIGTQNNTLLWNFTEYYTPGTTTPNGYYDLQNAYTGKYLAPQLVGNQTLSDNPIGVQLNGRLDGDFYTTILAWDDTHYDYAGLKIQNGQVMPAPMSQADTFYFAIVDPMDGDLTPIETVDNNEYGITMRMVNFDSNAAQCALLNNPQNEGSITKITSGLLDSTMTGDYPTASRTGRSLGELFANATEVNHLFLESIHSSSGYFQYDSTENFASLNGTDFDVYQELGGVGGTSGTRKHGQFMPYNTLDPETPHPENPENLTDIHANQLSDNNPRKHETLYDFNEEDDFWFGMEVAGDFMQTPSGKDSWGNDMIFEFTGDDDFWLFVDGELVLDIGGIHQAMEGSVNYRTGTVITEGVETSLYDIFKHNYAVKHGVSEDSLEVQEYLDETFQAHTEGGKTVYTFRDYSTHHINIYYMERGAGASNLRMRFNLETIVPGQIELAKEISGTEKNDYASVRFPYQIYYKRNNGESYRLLEPEQDPQTGKWNVVYKNTSTEVDYARSARIDGVTYPRVFYLKPGQAATIRLPADTVSYYIKECGVDDTIYDSVKANDTELTGTVPTGATHTKQYLTSAASPANRARVVYDNHVDEDALRTLSITKKLFDENGDPLTYEDDQSGFTFRIRIGEELGYYNQGDYHVKGANGEYCYYDAATSSFKSIGTNDLSTLSDADLYRVTFRTSPSGAVSKIPADHTVEINGLLVGTNFKITEEDYDIPIGYGKRVWTETEGGVEKTFVGYKRVEGSYITQEGDTENSGIIRDNSNPSIEVHNERGFGLRANKEWTDKDFMTSHEYTYFAVYVNGNLLPGTVRRIDGYNYTTYYFSSLEPGTQFSDYKVREVILTNPIVGNDGTVLYDSITPLAEDDQITLDGVNKDGDPETDLDYFVSYSQGTGTSQRTDTVTNRRADGLTIIKTDLSDNPLSSAEFTLTSGPRIIGTYTSNASGLVTTAYLEDGTYTLTEAKSPSGYQALTHDLTISIANGQISISGAQDAYTYNAQTKTLKVKNKPFTLKAVKVDADSGDELEDAHFALYKQIRGANGSYRKDYYPISGYEDLVSNSAGIIPNITQSLAPGSYYLTETTAPEGYQKLEEDVLFTIAPTGEVSLQSGNDYTGTLTHTGSDYTITIGNLSNSHLYGLLTVTKHVTGNMGDRSHQFTFTAALTGSDVPQSVTYQKGNTTGSIPVENNHISFTLSDAESIMFTNLPIGTVYQITENAEDYASTSQNASGTVSLSTTAVFNNTKDSIIPTGLKISGILSAIVLALIPLIRLTLRRRKRRR